MATMATKVAVSFKSCVNQLFILYSFFFLANTLILDCILGNAHFQQKSDWWLRTDIWVLIHHFKCKNSSKFNSYQWQLSWKWTVYINDPLFFSCQCWPRAIWPVGDSPMFVWSLTSRQVIQVNTHVCTQP